MKINTFIVYCALVVLSLVHLVVAGDPHPYIAAALVVSALHENAK